MRPAAPPDAGGYGVLVDPSQRADEAAVFWDPAELSSVILLTAAPIHSPPVLSFSPGEWPGVCMRIDAADGMHLLVKDAERRHQLWAPALIETGAPVAAVCTLDCEAQARAHALVSFWRHVAQEGSSRRSRPKQPKARRNHRADRLVMALRALDGRLQGASYRAIAEGLFGESRVALEPWKTSTLRDTTIRLVRTGLAMSQSGYRDLLKGRAW